MAILGQNQQERLFDGTGAHSFKVFREYHEARNATEYTIYFVDGNGKKRRADVWVPNEELPESDAEREDYVEALVLEAVRGALDNE